VYCIDILAAPSNRLFRDNRQQNATHRWQALKPPRALSATACRVAVKYDTWQYFTHCNSGRPRNLSRGGGANVETARPETLCWVGFSSPSVYLQHNSKTNDPKVFKLGIGNDLGYPRSGIVLGFKCRRSRRSFTGSISAFFTLMSGV